MSETLPEALTKEFVLAAHGDLAKVRQLLTEHPALLTVQHDWGPGGGLEDGIGAAAHMGNREIAEFFLAHGAPSNICVAAMLGQTEQVRAFLEHDPALANGRGAHGIPVMFHAAMSGDVTITTMLKNRGCTEGYNMALHGTISFAHTAMVAWLLDNGVTDPNMLNFQQKTPLARAQEAGLTEVAELLRKHGAKESVEPQSKQA